MKDAPRPTGARNRSAILALDHMDFRAPVVKGDFIHKLVDQKNSPPVAGENILPMTAVGDTGGIESWAGIAYHDQHSSRFIAADDAFDRL